MYEDPMNSHMADSLASFRTVRFLSSPLASLGSK